IASARELFGFLPEKEEKTWTREYVTPLGPLGSLTRKNSYRDEGGDSLDGKSVEKVTFRSNVAYTAPPEKTAQPASAQPSTFRVVKGDLKSPEPSKGTIHFDAQAGRLAG